MRYLSVCSGIEAASVAWHPLDWKPLAFSEIETFPRAVLAHHYPHVPVHGDFTKLRDEPFIADADVLVGGTPCQAFSVAGLRKSLDDDRGNLSLEFVRLADAIDDLRHAAGRQPAIIVWENVPGVLSVKDNAFGCFLAGLAGDVTPYDPPRGKWTDAGVVAGPQRAVAWRVLDAQYFGLAQRRRRVFVVASAREGFDPAAVLFEREGLRRDTAPSREAGQGVAGTIEASLGRSRGAGTPPGALSASTGDISHCLNAGGMGRQDYETETLVTHSLRAEGFDASEDGNGRGTPLVPVAFHPTQDPISSTDGSTHALGCGSSGGQASVAVAVPLQEVGKRTGVSTNDLRAGIGIGQEGDPMFTLQAGAQHGVAYPINTQIALRHEALGERTGMGIGNAEDPAFTLQAGHSHAVAFGGDVARTLSARHDSSPCVDRGMDVVASHMAVRRLTPVECERLQGFPDGYTNIPWRGKPEAPDGPRYKALGNSMAVPVMRWIGRRIVQHLKEVE